jgi:hypothetical protein
MGRTRGEAVDDDEPPRQRRLLDGLESNDRPRKRRHADDEDEEDEPQQRHVEEPDDAAGPRKRKRKRKKGGNGLFIGLFAAGSVLVIGVVILVFVFLPRASSGTLKSDIVGKWHSELRLEGRKDNAPFSINFDLTADFKGDGKGSMDIHVKVKFRGGIHEERANVSGDYRINGDILELPWPGITPSTKGKKTKGKVTLTIRGDEMTFVNREPLTEKERGMKDMGIEPPTQLAWKRVR